jgi:hypothetical protein
MLKSVREAFVDAVSDSFETSSLFDVAHLCTTFEEFSDEYSLCFDRKICNDLMRYSALQSISDAIDIFLGISLNHSLL